MLIYNANSVVQFCLEHNKLIGCFIRSGGFVVWYGCNTQISYTYWYS